MQNGKEKGNKEKWLMAFPDLPVISQSQETPIPMEYTVKTLQEESGLLPWLVLSLLSIL
jgi:uncharacterized protein (DUF1810 family)